MLQYETISRWSLTSVLLNWTNGLLRLINSMVTELIRPVNYNPGRSQKPIKLEISSCRYSQLECNEENDETEGYSSLYTPLLPLSGHSKIDKTKILMTNASLMKVESIAECSPWSISPWSILQYL